MHIIKIPKGNGKFRTIYAPNKYEKWASKRALRRLRSDFVIDRIGVQHGFTNRRSPVTNALKHKGWRFTLSFDLKDFFDTVTPMKLNNAGVSLNYIGAALASAFYEGVARQGLPSSPTVANLAAGPIDEDIAALNQPTRFGRMFCYTRYADDLTFSFNYAGIGDMLKEEIPKLITKHGFVLNESKTHLQSARQGRRMITGVAVDDEGVHLPRSQKRKLRAIQHQLNNGLRGRGLRLQIARQRESKWRRDKDVSLAALIHGQQRGLLEWAKLKLPDGYVDEEVGLPAKTGATTVTVDSGGALPAVSLPPGHRRFAM